MSDTSAPLEQVLPLKLTDVAHLAGISYRQADFWCRQGYLRTVSYDSELDRPRNRPPAASARRMRRLEDAEARVLLLMGRLTRAGLMPEAAHKAARQVIGTREGACQLADGVHLVLSGELP